uniref:Uncharacterized protein n=1 Tax=Cyanoderma ruficeps TaxID=181631 RepID=A0A8C3P6D0_9PASS
PAPHAAGKTFRVHQVPQGCLIFWEDGIMLGYWCPKSSTLHCVLSSFQMMNETALDALPADQVGMGTGMERRMGIGMAMGMGMEI